VGEEEDDGNVCCVVFGDVARIVVDDGGPVARVVMSRASSGFGVEATVVVTPETAFVAEEDTMVVVGANVVDGSVLFWGCSVVVAIDAGTVVFIVGGGATDGSVGCVMGATVVVGFISVVGVIFVGDEV
jgi:hypothetical protein